MITSRKRVLSNLYVCDWYCSLQPIATVMRLLGVVVELLLDHVFFCLVFAINYITWKHLLNPKNLVIMHHNLLSASLSLRFCRQRRRVSGQSSRELVESLREMPSRELQSQSQHDQAPRDRERERHLVHENVTPFNNISAIEPFVNRRSLSSREVSRKLGEEQSLQKRFWREGQDNRKKAESTSVLYWPNNETPSSFFSGVLAQTSSSSADFTHLPFDVLQRIAGSFSWPDLWAATCTCKLWSKALAPLREGMLLLHWGKMFKHGRGVAKNLDKALESFRKGAVHGCAPAMVDAGLLLWELVGPCSWCSLMRMWTMLVCYKYQSFCLTQWECPSGVGPLWFSIGCIGYKMNKVFPLVVHAER